MKTSVYINKQLRMLMRILSIHIVKEEPGVICDTACWVVVHRCWMYGPYEHLWPCIRDMLFEWKHDRHLVG